MAKTYKLNFVFLGAIVASVIVPRFVKNSEGGLASAATSVLLFFAVLALAAFVALYQFSDTLHSRRVLSKRQRVFGYAPLVLSVIGGILLVTSLRF